MGDRGGRSETMKRAVLVIAMVGMVIGLGLGFAPVNHEPKVNCGSAFLPKAEAKDTGLGGRIDRGLDKLTGEAVGDRCHRAQQERRTLAVAVLIGSLCLGVAGYLVVRT
jgi:hypothetical protein